MLNCYVIKLHIKKSETYMQITMHSHNVDLLPPSPPRPPPHTKKSIKAPTFKPSDVILLFCLPLNYCWLVLVS